MIGRRSWALAIAGVSLVACSSTDSGAPSSEDSGSDVIMSPLDGGGSDSAAAMVTQTVGAAGGTVTAPGVVLTIPAGALAGDTEISITTNGSAPAGYTGLTPVYAFAPGGTVLLHAATVDFTIAAANPGATVFWSNAGGAYDPLSTTTVADSVTASITRLGDAFVGVVQAVSDAGTDAGVTADGGPMADAGAADSGTPGDSGVAADSGGAVDSGLFDSGIFDSGIVDAAIGDAGIIGITATIDTVPTTFAVNPSWANLNGIAVITADDSASTTHWQMQLEVTTVPQQACSSTGYPQIIYSHFTAGAVDSVYYSNQNSGHCNIIVEASATASGMHARGLFSGTVNIPPEAGAGSHTLASGSYDVIR
jgi:hypothetical protein